MDLNPSKAVIQHSTQNQIWSLKCYRRIGGKDVVNEWYTDPKTDSRDKSYAKSRISRLLPRSRNEWNPKHVKPLNEGRCVGLYEIVAGSCRILGGFGPGEFVFTLYHVVHKKDIHGSMEHDCSVVRNRIGDVENDANRALPCSF